MISNSDSFPVDSRSFFIIEFNYFLCYDYKLADLSYWRCRFLFSLNMILDNLLLINAFFVKLNS